MSVTLKTTRYGLSPRVAGWDKPGDSGTDNWLGNHGNALTTASCALTMSAETLLAESLLSSSDLRLGRDVNGQIIPGRLKPGVLIKVIWPGTHLVSYRTFDDRAPESDARLDLFLPWKDDPSIPDHGQAELA